MELESQERINVQMADGVTDLTIRHGQASKLLDEIAPIKTDISGTIGAVAEYISKRVNEFDHRQAYIVVNRENVSITLHINESDAYTRGKVAGAMQYHPKFVEFGINTGKSWSPVELAMTCKMNRAFFESLDANRTLVSTLMHFTADINQKVDRAVAENGNMADSFSQVVSSNLPKAFTMKIPIFKGGQAEILEVETFASINGREVQFLLLSPGATETLETIRDKAIDKQLATIREIAEDIVIIEE